MRMIEPLEFCDSQRQSLLSVGVCPTLHRQHNFRFAPWSRMHNVRCIDPLGYRVDNAAINLIKEESHV